MSAAWSFVAGWISCGAFIFVGLLVRRRPKFQSTSQFMEACDELAPLPREVLETYR